MDNKVYYWLLYTGDNNSKNLENWQETVVDIHPFTATKMLRKQLISWQTITKKDYDLWKQLNEK